MSHLFSLIIPVYNEEESLPFLRERLLKLVDKIDMKVEVILVDDGSRDRSREMLRKLHQEDNRFKIIGLSRNFGHQIAISAGMRYCQGDCAVIMDADLQDPPEVILEMIQKWREGFDIVYGVRKSRAGESFFKLVTAAVYYRLLKSMVTIDIPLDTGDFRLIDRKVIDAFNQLKEKNRFVRGLFGWLGFKTTGVQYHRDQRLAGETKYPLKKMVKLAIDGMISFSNLPLQMILKFGFWMAILSLIGGVAALGLKFFGGFVVRGWTSLFLFNSFIAGVQLIVMGVIGEYIGRISDEVKGRPLFFVGESWGFEQQEKNRLVSNG